MQETQQAVAIGCGDIPPIFGLKAVPKLFPNTYAPGTLRILIRAGRGPRHFKRQGRIFLRREDYVAWLTEEAGHGPSED